MASQADSEVVTAEPEEEFTEVAEQETEAEGQPEAEATPETEGKGSETDEVIVTIGDESPTSEDEDFHGKAAPEWVRDLRKKAKDDARRIRELEQQLQTAKPAEEAVKVGAKPKLEDFDYDAERFEREYDAWTQRKLAVEAKEREKREQQEAADRAWKAKLDNYGKAKASLKVSDFDDAEAVAQTTLSVTQQGIVVSGSENPALLMYALGRNPKKAAELAAITDPVQFAFAVAKVETQLKTTPRKPVPPPEKTVRGTSPAGVSQAARLDKLLDQARKTGDYTEYYRAKHGK